MVKISTLYISCKDVTEHVVFGEGLVRIYEKEIVPGKREGFIF